MLNPNELEQWISWFKRYYQSDNDAVVLRRMTQALKDIYAQGYKVYMLRTGKLKINLGEVETFNENDRREHYTIHACSIHILPSGSYELHGTATCRTNSSRVAPHPNVVDNRGGHICQGNATYITEFAQDRELAMLVTTLDEFVRQYSSISPYWVPMIDIDVCDGCIGKDIVCEHCMCMNGCMYDGGSRVRRNNELNVVNCSVGSCEVRRRGYAQAIDEDEVPDILAHILKGCDNLVHFVDTIDNTLARNMFAEYGKFGIERYIYSHAGKTDLIHILEGIHNGTINYTRTEGTDSEREGNAFEESNTGEEAERTPEEQNHIQRLRQVIDERRQERERTEGYRTGGTVTTAGSDASNYTFVPHSGTTITYQRRYVRHTDDGTY